MTVKDLELLFEYGYWANSKLMGPLSRLTEEEFTLKIGGAYESIRTTLVHIMSAEWGWLGRCGGPERGPRLNAANFPTLQSVSETGEKIEGYWRDFLSKLTDDDLQRVVEYSNDFGEKREMPIGELMQHVVFHGAHHRGQVSLMLRELGYSPGNIDLLFYYAEKLGIPVW